MGNYILAVVPPHRHNRIWRRRAFFAIDDLASGAGDGAITLTGLAPPGVAARNRDQIEFLIDDASLEPHHLRFVKNLGVLGIDATVRIVDPVQYRARLNEFDFDMTVGEFWVTAPGDNLWTYFTSQAAATKGSQNLAGIADPVIDALVEQIAVAPTRPELITACRALDRVFRAGRYWVSHWHGSGHRIAYWDVFGHPATKPRYARGAPETWWYDRERAAKLERAG
jgi:microcin C transport system substrate-binding protein